MSVAGPWPVPAAAVALAAGAAALAFWADARFPGSVLALVSIPVALLGAFGAARRWLSLVAAAALAADVGVIAYAIYDLVTAIHGAG
jgi:hypothetical protein